MPSARHDALSQLFAGDPPLAGLVLRQCTGSRLDAGLPARLELPRFSDRLSADFDADVVVVHGPVRDPVHGTIIEIQQDKIREKLDKLARYAAALWLLIRCPVDVLVICPDRAVADFYARPVPTSLPGYVLTPRVVGPVQVPVITDPEHVAASPGLAVLSVAMHGDEPGVCEAFVTGLASVRPEQGSAYYEMAHAACAAAARSVLEELVSTTTWLVSSPFAKEHFGRGKAEGLAEGEARGLAEGEARGLAEGEARGLAEGEAKGEADAVLLVLKARDLEVTPTDRARISACTDLDQLRTWVSRAATVTAVSDLFR